MATFTVPSVIPMTAVVPGATGGAGFAAASAAAPADGSDEIDVLAELEDVALVPKRGRSALEVADVAGLAGTSSHAARGGGRGGSLAARVARITMRLCCMALPVSAAYCAGACGAGRARAASRALCGVRGSVCLCAQRFVRSPPGFMLRFISVIFMGHLGAAELAGAALGSLTGACTYIAACVGSGWSKCAHIRGVCSPVIGAWRRLDCVRS